VAKWTAALTIEKESVVVVDMQVRLGESGGASVVTQLANGEQRSSGQVRKQVA
jgi:hypothetical protein